MTDDSISVSAQLVTGLTDKLDRAHHEADRRKHAVYQQTFDPMQLTLDGSGDGTLDEPTRMGPNRGFMWSVRRLTLSGFTAGTCIVYIDGLEPLPFPQAGMYTFGRGEFLLNTGQRLTIVASSITGYVQWNGAADVFETWFLPEYIG
jgi:hypothetical protein